MNKIDKDQKRKFLIESLKSASFKKSNNNIMKKGMKKIS